MLRPCRRMLQARKLTLVAVVALVAIPSAALAAVPTADGAEPMRLGMDVASIEKLTAAGATPDYGVFWVGPWNLPDYWNLPESELRKAKAAGVTPVIQFYYWGDSISPSCVENGCDGKTREGWDELASGLVERLDKYLQGSPVIIVLETEFNKGGIEDSDAFDAMLAEKARYFESAYPAATTVLGFGNWEREAWGNFDQAMAAVDMAGLQAMRGSTRHELDQYLGAADKTLAGAQELQRLFGKPVLVTDIALSSYPEPEYLDHQDAALKAFLERSDAFRDAGVVGFIYRGIEDNPDFPLKNHFGMAERYWGLVGSDGTVKPALGTWVAAASAERNAD